MNLICIIGGKLFMLLESQFSLLNFSIDTIIELVTIKIFPNQSSSERARRIIANMG